MTLKELAATLGVQAASLRNQVRRGALVAVKSGRDWFVTDAEAERYARDQAGKMGAASPRHSRIGNRHPRKNGNMPALSATNITTPEPLRDGNKTNRAE